MRTTNQSLKCLVDSQKGERNVVQFLAKHPQLLRDYFLKVTGHCQYVLTEVSLGGELKIDAVVLNGHSGSWEGYFVEFEPVANKVFNKDRTPTARTKEAIKQIADWRQYIRLNPTEFRRKLAKLCQTQDRLGQEDPKFEACTGSDHRLKDAETVMWEHFWIITGRRENLSQEVRGLMARQHTEMDIFMGSYDGFLDLAKAIPKQTSPNEPPDRIL